MAAATFTCSVCGRVQGTSRLRRVLPDGTRECNDCANERIGRTGGVYQSHPIRMAEVASEVGVSRAYVYQMLKGTPEQRSRVRAAIRRILAREPERLLKMRRRQ